ncbi:unnamed protein product [Darwinula stevensoni]|uniref:Uncharacterized protein n=1 Tax=Darwinula stevensoni TaxID=69355 RepID=A0A7R8X8T5_9CRUS|nr:unnamed protein product [Darwinula stevensoni]CAG0890464.1 unnamed protein product [Darwinula stevensoni]
MDDIKVLGGRGENIQEDLDLCNFLKKQEKERHVLLDEVPITLGFRGHLDEATLSDYWGGIISNLKKNIKSLTLAFRPHDSTYARDIDLRGMQIPNVRVEVLSAVRGKTRNATNLVMALESYPCRKFFCDQPSLKDMDFGQPKNDFQPKSCIIPACHDIHDICRFQATCEVVRSSHAIFPFVRDHLAKPEKPIYIVVDSIERRNRFVNILSSIYDTSVIFIDKDGTFRKTSSLKISPVVVVTAEQFLGYHGDNTIVILDLPSCKWCNYTRMVSSCEENIIIVGEKESLQKYYNIGIKLQENTAKNEEGLMQEIKKAEDMQKVEMAHLEEKACFHSILNQNMSGNFMVVLVSDKTLMAALKEITPDDARKVLTFYHPGKYRGCTANIIVTVNVEDIWLLESVSRAKTHIFIIDTLPSHQQFWNAMEEEGHLEVQVTTTDDNVMEKETLFRLAGEKEFLQCVPSLTVADYAFTDTLLKGVKQQQKTRFIKNFGVTEEDLPSGDHDVFGTGISGSSIIGLFFQVKGTISGVNPKGILDNMAIATKQLEKDLNIFRTMCGEFLNPIVKLAGFVAFPMLSRSDIQKRIKCINCRTRILVFEDLAKPRSFRRFLARQGIVLEKYYRHDPESHIMKTFKNIFDLYVCAASAVDLPRNLHQLFNKNEEQMEKMLVLLTPQQRKLVMTKSKFIFLSGGSGTGKTFVLKKRALELAAEGEVLVINIAGGLLTEEFRHDFEGKKGIVVIDGRTEGLEDFKKFKEFLIEKGKGKHVLINEATITLGFQGPLTPEALSSHWEWIAESQNHFKSIILAFRPNDQSYSRDFPLQELKPGGIQIEVLNRVKRNSRYISQLFLAISDYSRRIFISREKTLRMNIKEPEEPSLPILYPIPSCISLHPNGCRDETTCQTVRTCHIIKCILEECSLSQNKLPPLIVIDEERKASFVHFLTALYHLVPALLVEDELESEKNNEKIQPKRKVEFHCPSATNVSPDLVVVTESEIAGCHLNNVTVIVDLPHSNWGNYIRLIGTSGENKILLIEEEELTTGKFSRIVKEISGWNIKTPSDRRKDLAQYLEQAWNSDYKTTALIEEGGFHPVPFPQMEINYDERKKEDGELIHNILSHCLTGIFGFPSSGKSRTLDGVINRLVELGEQVFLLHCGSVLSQELSRQKWGHEANVDIADANVNEITSLQDVIDYVEIEEEGRENKKKDFQKGGAEEIKAENKTERKRVNNGRSYQFLVVDDCPVWKRMEYEIGDAVENLKEKKMKLIISFKPQSKNAKRISVQSIMDVMNDNSECSALMLTSAYSGIHKKLLAHIQQNEASSGLTLQAKSLQTSSMPAAIVWGSKIVYLNHKCSGRHWGYLCNEEERCESIEPVLPSLLLFALSRAGGCDITEMEPNATEGDVIYVLFSDDDLLASLQSQVYKRLGENLRTKFLHCRDFWGCEASSVISVNVDDSFLLEVLSRGRIQLILVDTTPNHKDLWTAMTDEGRTDDCPVIFPEWPKDNVMDLQTLLRMEGRVHFLQLAERLSYSGAQHSLPLAVQRSKRLYAHLLAVHH